MIDQQNIFEKYIQNSYILFWVLIIFYYSKFVHRIYIKKYIAY